MRIFKNYHETGSITYPKGYVRSEIGCLKHFDIRIDNDDKRQRTIDELEEELGFVQLAINFDLYGDCPSGVRPEVMDLLCDVISLIPKRKEK